MANNTKITEELKQEIIKLIAGLLEQAFEEFRENLRSGQEVQLPKEPAEQPVPQAQPEDKAVGQPPAEIPADPIVVQPAQAPVPELRVQAPAPQPQPVMVPQPVQVDGQPAVAGLAPIPVPAAIQPPIPVVQQSVQIPAQAVPLTPPVPTERAVTQVPVQAPVPAPATPATFQTPAIAPVQPGTPVTLTAPVQEPGPQQIQPTPSPQAPQQALSPIQAGAQDPVIVSQQPVIASPAPDITVSQPVLLPLPPQLPVQTTPSVPIVSADRPVAPAPVALAAPAATVQPVAPAVLAAPVQEPESRQVQLTQPQQVPQQTPQPVQVPVQAPATPVQQPVPVPVQEQPPQTPELPQQLPLRTTEAAPPRPVPDEPIQQPVIQQVPPQQQPVPVPVPAMQIAESQVTQPPQSPYRPYTPEEIARQQGVSRDVGRIENETSYGSSVAFADAGNANLAKTEAMQEERSIGNAIASGANQGGYQPDEEQSPASQVHQRAAMKAEHRRERMRERGQTPHIDRFKEGVEERQYQPPATPPRREPKTADPVLYLPEVESVDDFNVVTYPQRERDQRTGNFETDNGDLQGSSDRAIDAVHSLFKTITSFLDRLADNSRTAKRNVEQLDSEQAREVKL